MSERGNFRGRGGGTRGEGGGERGRGGGPSARGGAHGQGAEKPKKENILDLSKYMDKEIMVKFNGGRESELGRIRFWILGVYFYFGSLLADCCVCSANSTRDAEGS